MLKHKGTQIIETPRLILRQARIEDAEPMFRNWANDPDVTKYLTWPPHGSVEVTKQLLTSWVESYEKDDYYQWMIVLKETKEPIGSIMASTMGRAIGSIMASTMGRAQSAHIGYCIGTKWWHQGIMSETLKVVMDFLFDEVGYHRIEAMHDPNNPNSGMVMAKCGMRFEGTLRQADRNNQGICDACYYGILASERK